MSDTLSAEQESFIDTKASYEFWTFTAATFLTFLTATQALFLSSILQSRGISPLGIGAVAGSYGIGVIVTSLGIQSLIRTIGLIQAARLGIALTGMGYGSLALTLDHELGMMLSRFIQGAGFGVFLTPAIAYARSRLGPGRFLQLLGVYTGSIPLPQALGPAYAEWQYKVLPGPGLFLVGLVPIVAALILTLPLRSIQASGQPAKKIGIIDTLRVPSVIWPLAAITIVGILFGFETAFTAPVLTNKSIPVFYFFSTVSAAMFASQLFVLRYIKDYSEKTVIALSFALLSFSFAIVHFGDAPAVMLLAGAAFGLGYSVVFPVLNAAVTRPFPPDERTGPLAVFNLFYNSGMIVTPYLVGATVQKSQYGSILLGMAVIAGVAALAAFLFKGFGEAKR